VEIPRVDGVDVPVLAAGNPVKLSGMPEPSANTVPSVGEGTAELLGEELGLDDDTLRTLQADGVIGGL
jgi:crotonobetainyl-CoA:carnitine CoA-transferase CaiB-like acyl-CoA transferase